MVKRYAYILYKIYQFDSNQIIGKQISERFGFHQTKTGILHAINKQTKHLVS